MATPAHSNRRYLDHCPSTVSSPNILEVLYVSLKPSALALFTKHSHIPRVYVAYPKIAQSGVDDSTLEIQSMSLTNPTSTTFGLELQTVVRSDNRYQPHLDAFDASLYLNNPDGEPFSYIQVPAVHATKEALSISNQTINIADLSSQFADYTGVVLASEEYDLIVKGRTDLHEGRLPTTTVDYNKVVTLKGKCKTLISNSQPIRSHSITLDILQV